MTTKMVDTATQIAHLRRKLRQVQEAARVALRKAEDVQCHHGCEPGTCTGGDLRAALAPLVGLATEEGRA